MSISRIKAETDRAVKKGNSGLCRRNRRAAREKWGLQGRHPLLLALNGLSEEFALSVSAGEVILLQDKLYVTHAGLLRIARRNRCSITSIATGFFCSPTRQAATRPTRLSAPRGWAGKSAYRTGSNSK